MSALLRRRARRSTPPTSQPSRESSAAPSSSRRTALPPTEERSAHHSILGAFVLAPDGSAGASFCGADWSATLASPGVVDVVSAADFPNPAANATAAADSNCYPFYLHPVGSPLPCVGAPVAVVLADSLSHARRGAQPSAHASSTLRPFAR